MSSMAARLDGTLFVSQTRLLYLGPLVATARHAHHAALERNGGPSRPQPPMKKV